MSTLNRLHSQRAIERTTRARMNDATLSVSSSLEALEHAKCCWIAEPQQLITAAGKDVESHKAMVRSDTGAIIGIVGKDWTPIQNAEAFAFFDTIVKEKGMSYIKAKEIDGGSKVFLQAKVSTGEVRKGDIVENRLTLVNAFNGSSSFMIRMTPMRLVCTNGLLSADKAHSIHVRIRHTRSAKERYEQALMIFAGAQKAFQTFLDASRALTQKMVDKEMVRRFLNSTFGDENNESARIRNQKNDSFILSQAGAGNGQGTLWDLYNGVTDFVDHARSKNPEQAEVSALFGSGSHIKERAFSAALAEIGVR